MPVAKSLGALPGCVRLPLAMPAPRPRGGGIYSFYTGAAPRLPAARASGASHLFGFVTSQRLPGAVYRLLRVCSCVLFFYTDTAPDCPLPEHPTSWPTPVYSRSTLGLFFSLFVLIGHVAEAA